MTHRRAARPASPRFPRIPLGGRLVLIAAIAAALGYPVVSSAVSMAASLQRGGLGEADGFISDGASVFDDEIPALANLDPSLRTAVRRAATAAAKDGVEFQITSGWRSPEYQEQLLREAISEHGSGAEAARWVGTSTTSAHVSGDAVDIGPFDAVAWLSEHGARYGLCQIYRNEPWHYELRPDATGRRCPRMYADPTHDPRMQP